MSADGVSSQPTRANLGSLFDQLPDEDQEALLEKQKKMEYQQNEDQVHLIEELKTDTAAEEAFRSLLERYFEMEPDVHDIHMAALRRGMEELVAGSSTILWRRLRTRTDTADASYTLQELDRAATRWRDLLRSPRWQDRHLAVAAMGHTANPASIDECIATLSDRSKYVRIQAARSLASIGMPEAVEALFVACSDPSDEVAVRAAETMQVVWRAALPYARFLLRRGRYRDTQAAGARILQEAGDQIAEAELVEALDEEKDEWVKCQILTCLAKMRSLHATALLLPRLGGAATIREQCRFAEALGWTGDRQATPVLIALLDQVRSGPGRRRLCHSLVTALLHIGDPGAVGPVLKLVLSAYNDWDGLEVADRDLVRVATLAVGGLAKPNDADGVSVLHGLAQRAGAADDVRCAALLSLANIGGSKARAALKALAHAKFPLNSWVAEARRYLDIHEDTPAANAAISRASDGLAPWVAAIEEWRQLTEVCRQSRPTEREIVCEGFRPDDELQELLKNRAPPPTPQRRALATATGDEDLSPKALRPKRSQLGFYVLRQRGGEPSAAQMTSVTSAVKELFSVVGDLSALFEADGLRFVHSEGRLPFGWVWHLGRKKTRALYRPVTNLIAIGAEGDPLPALAHEWGHWLDYRALDTNLTACSCYGLPEMHILLVQAAGSMDQVFELLPHEMCPTEIWARLVAQYVYRELCAMKGLRPAFLCAGERYASGAGYWSEGAWQELQLGVVEAIQGRLSDMAGRLSVSLERGVVLWQG